MQYLPDKDLHYTAHALTMEIMKQNITPPNISASEQALLDYVDAYSEIYKRIIERLQA